MLRKVLGVIVGYVAMFVFIMATFTGLYAVLQADGAFRPGSFSPSMTWILITFVLSIVAALIGGYVCKAIGRTDGPVKVLIGIVLVLGLAMAAAQAFTEVDPDSLARAGDVGSTEAMQRAQQPLWVSLLNPIVGAVGVFLGARLRRDR